MNRAARLISTTAIAFLLVPTLFADDTTKPKARAKDETAASCNAPGTRGVLAKADASSASILPSGAAGLPADAQPQPDAWPARPVSFAATSPAPPEGNAESVG